jgi:hypothetical protein
MQKKNPRKHLKISIDFPIRPASKMTSNHFMKSPPRLLVCVTHIVCEKGWYVTLEVGSGKKIWLLGWGCNSVNFACTMPLVQSPAPEKKRREEKRKGSGKGGREGGKEKEGNKEGRKEGRKEGGRDGGREE